MIQVTPQMRILLAVEPVDFRKGIHGLVAVCKNVLGSDPFCGYMFVFMNKKTGHQDFGLGWSGLLVVPKKVVQGPFLLVPDKRQSPLIRLLVHELQFVIWNGNPDKWMPWNYEKSISTKADGLILTGKSSFHLWLTAVIEKLSYACLPEDTLFAAVFFSAVGPKFSTAPCDLPMLSKLFRLTVTISWAALEKETLDDIIFRTTSD